MSVPVAHHIPLNIILSASHLSSRVGREGVLSTMLSDLLEKKFCPIFWGDLPKILRVGGPKIFGGPKIYGGT